MDQFGIGAAIRSMARIYFQVARGTGRTTLLAKSVKDGDRIIFSSAVEAARVHRMLVARGVQVECIVIDPRSPARALERGPARGRTVFDHSWVEAWYTAAIDRAAEDIDYFERRLSAPDIAIDPKDKSFQERGWELLREAARPEKFEP